MENQRLFLWSALAIIVFFMMQSWQKDYAPALPAATIEVQDSAETVPELSVPGIDSPLPGTPEVKVTENEKVKQNQGTIVSVRTDVYLLELNTLGAGITKLELPKHPKSKKTPDDVVELFTQNAEETYLLNSGLRASGVSTEPTHQAQWKSARSKYELGDNAQNLKVPFTWTSPEGLMVTKTYIFSRNSFAFQVVYTVENKSSSSIAVRSYAQLERSHPPLARSMVSVDSYSFKGPTWFDGEKYEKLKTKDLIKDPINTEITNAWLATIEHHFLAAIVPAKDVAYTIQANSKDEDSYRLTAAAPAQNIAPGLRVEITQQYFAGPKIQKQLRTLSPKLDLTTDYGFFSIVSKPLFWLLAIVHGFLGNWGWSIIVVTLIIKAIFYPLTAKSSRSMAAMKKIQPRIKLIQERHKDDRQALSKATMELYKREKINPAAGCLPIFIQFPFFLGFYWLLIESVELRQAPWMLWIQDLSSKDPLFILPVLYGVTMYLQQKVQPMSGGNAEMMKVMKFMPIAMVGLFSFFPAGLVLYWITNSAVTVLQQWRINTVLDKESKR